MKSRHVPLVLLWSAALGVLIQCGSSASTPTGTTTPTPLTVQATPTPTPTPGSALPPGLVCDPTPPPIVRMHIGVHSREGGRIVLDSKPLVANVDNYCDRVGFGGWKFCETRPEGHSQRVACDYLVTGKAEDSGRWGPTWWYDRGLCSENPTQCALHPTEQFLAIAKAAGRYTACAREDYPVADGGNLCGWIDMP
jgi:hypothetical protein